MSDESLEEDLPTTPSLLDLVAAMAERSRARREAGEEVWTHSPPEGPRARLPVVGCLVRLVLFIIFMIVLVFGGWFVLLTGGSW